MNDAMTFHHALKVLNIARGINTKSKTAETAYLCMWTAAKAVVILAEKEITGFVGEVFINNGDLFVVIGPLGKRKK